MIDNFVTYCKTRSNIKLPYYFGIEICERPELPNKIRSQVFDALGTAARLFSGIQKVFPALITQVQNDIAKQVGLKANSSFRWIELGSGGGETINWIDDSIYQSKFSYVLTDHYPHPDLWNRKIDKFNDDRKKKIIAVNNSVSFSNFAEVLPKEIADIESNLNVTNVILVVSAFHHIPNKDLLVFFEQASKLKSHVVVLEPLERDLKSLLISTAATFPSLLMPVISYQPKKTLIKNFKIQLELALTHWIFPIVPFIFLHDGFVSVTRQRTFKDFDDFFNKKSSKIGDKPLSQVYQAINDPNLQEMGTFKNFNAKVFVYQTPP